jgi:hypothetical protein
MKTEALDKALAAAREQAGSLQYKADQLGQTARAAKDTARQAKSRLKLAKQEAKQARKKAKEAKRAFGEASRAAEEAAVKLARLVKGLQKARQKAARGPTKNGKGKRAVVRKPAVPKAPRTRKTVKPASGSSTVGPAAPRKTASRPSSAPRPMSPMRLNAPIEVPRDFEVPPPAVAAENPTVRNEAAVPDPDESD